MKKSVVLFLLVILSSGIKAKSLTAYFSYCAFEAPGHQNYIETYLNVVGKTVNFVATGNNQLQGEIEVKWIFKSGDKIVHFDKYKLVSPPMAKGDSVFPNFVDQQRVNLEKGVYTVELYIQDKNGESKEFPLKEEITVGFPQDTIAISDIELIESFTKEETPDKFSKSGYKIIPFADVYYPKEINRLKFYAEIYRSDLVTTGNYLVRYYLSNKEKHIILENYVGNIKQSAKSINVVIGDFGIADLFSGNYNLNIEVRDKDNKLIAFKQLFFQRSNQPNKPLLTASIDATDVTNTFVSSIHNLDTLIEYVACVYPISSSMEGEIGESRIQQANMKNLQQFFYYFWAKRDSEDPERAWNNYHAEVIKVNAAYSTQNRRGYDTDRGRVYLQYGPPNAVSANNDDVDAYPYEIWQYYKLNTQTNRKFVFYAKELSSNEYVLLHSDAKGEIQNANWELKLHDRSQQFGNDLDQSQSIDIYGSHTKEDFKNPR